jgi:hypothetical protein
MSGAVLTERNVYGAVWVPMVPDACLLPNRRRNAHWSVQNDATQALRTAAKHGTHVIDPAHSLPLSPRVEIAYAVFWGDRYPGKTQLPDVDALPTACKGILDGLIDAGILVDDSDRYVGRVSAHQMRDELKYYGQGVYVRILRCEEATR